MKYTEEDLDLRILFRLISFANTNPGFDRVFIDKVYDYYVNHDYVKGEQMKKLTKIYYSEAVDELYEDED
jgi:hypothetical protein